MFGDFRTKIQEEQDGEGISMKEKDEERTSDEQDGGKASNCELKRQDGEVSSSCKGKDQDGKSATSCFVEERIKIVVEFLERNRRVDSSKLVQYLDKEQSINSGLESNILNRIGSEELRDIKDTEMNSLEKTTNTKDGLDLLISERQEDTEKEPQNSGETPSSSENNQPRINTTEEGIRKVLAASALLNLKIPSPILSSPNLSPAAVSPSTSNGNLLTIALAKTVPRRQRGEKKPIPEDLKDGKYFERRKRNNLAAKKSRDQRKIREDQICNRADSLEKENAVLRAQVCTLRDEASSLRALLLKKRLSKKTQYSGS